MSEAIALRIIAGNATEEEIAAILAALAQLPEPASTDPQGDAWMSRSHAFRRPLDRGPQAWRMSLR